MPISQLGNIPLFSSNQKKVTGNNNYSFVSQDTNLTIINVSNPSSPTVVSSTSLTGNLLTEVLLIENKWLLVGSDIIGILCYDATNVLNGSSMTLPSPTHTISVDQDGFAPSHFVYYASQQYVYVGIGVDHNGISFIHIAQYDFDPQASLPFIHDPDSFDYVTLSDLGQSMTNQINGSLIVARIQSPGIGVVELRDPNNIGSITATQVVSATPRDIAAKKYPGDISGVVYCATDNGVEYFEVDAGSVISGVTTIPGTRSDVTAIDHCFISTDINGTDFKLYNVTNSLSPVLDQSITYPSTGRAKPFLTANRMYAAPDTRFLTYSWSLTGAPPTASFTFDTTGTQATFTDTSTGSPTSWSWNFGDPGSGVSNTSTLQNPTHTFSGYDAYTVTLTATNGSGASTPFQDDVTTSPPPTASFTFNTVNKLGTFTDTSTESPTSWSWNFGDPASNANNTSTLQNPTHTFTSYANYTVTLTSSNSDGSDPFESVVTTTPPPTGSFTFEVLGKQGTFTDTSTGAPTSWAWNFGDPDSGANNTSTVQNPIHVFSGFDTYTVTLTATNGNGSSSPFQDDVTTESITPPFRFTINFGIPTRAPGSGTVQLPFTGYYEDNSPVDITLAQYSLNGTLFQNASALSASDTDNLVFGPDGVGHVFNWKASEDLGNDFFNKTIYFKMQATSPEFVSSISETTFTIVKVTTTGSKKDEVVFPGFYKGTSGNSILGIFKGSK